MIDIKGSIDWLCLPRPDSPPVFGGLLDKDGGKFQIFTESKAEYRQSYIANTNVLVTEVELGASSFRIIDFMPRFMQFGRVYRPNEMFRIVEPVRRTPTIRVSCCPVNGWEKTSPRPMRGNSHLRWELGNDVLRVTTNMPLTYFAEHTAFALVEPLYFGLTWNVSIDAHLPTVARQFLDNTIEYWRSWVKHCSIPAWYQKEVIRSALTLKLHCFEDTGAILAALSTSLPEAEGEGRNWDYRFCWLRDAYYTLSAFHSLGQFEEMEGFLKFMLGIADLRDEVGGRLHPVYRLDRTLPLPEEEHASWDGYGGNKPVRSNNQAAEHVQNDVYGEMVLTLTPIFFDERFEHLRSPEHERLLKQLGAFCAQSINKPDAGLWELRNKLQVHSFTNLMSWAALERMLRLQEAGLFKDIQFSLKDSLHAADMALQGAVFEGALRNGPTDQTFDASLLQLPLLRYPNQKLNERTIELTTQGLTFNGEKNCAYLYRYLRKDDFGRPQAAFIICSFWLVQALARNGRIDEAREVMAEITASGNHLGLYSEHYDPIRRIQSGNFPQAYSHVGLINAAFSISPPWDNIL